MRYLFTLTGLFLLIGCGNAIKGNGNVVEVSREVPNFQDLETKGSIDVELQPGESYSLKIVTDENIVPYVQTNVKGSLLNIEYDKKVNIRDSKTKVIVTVPFVNSITTSGSGDISSAGTITNGKQISLKSNGSGDFNIAVNAPALKVSGSGSGDFKLSGDTKDIEYSLTGSGDVEGKDLRAENVEIRISGTGNADVFASNSLRARIAGSGNIRYWGNPSLDEVSVSGSGKLRAGN